MKVKELIEELKKFDDNLDVMAAGETAMRVVEENASGHRYVRIFEGINCEMVLGSAGI